MFNDMRKHVHDYSDEEEVSVYLKKLLHKEAFDKRGLIYGMGHAIYSVSDPRAEVFKGYVEQLAREKGRMKDYQLYATVERLAPKVIAEERKIYKGVSANVDFYSGFVYSMLDLPLELYTPIFCSGTYCGLERHRMEELINTDKIIRPATRTFWLRLYTYRLRSVNKNDSEASSLPWVLEAGEAGEYLQQGSGLSYGKRGEIPICGGCFRWFLQCFLIMYPGSWKDQRLHDHRG